MSEWFVHGGNPVCRRWHEGWVEEAAAGGEEEALRNIKGPLREELEKEYEKVEGGHLVKDELVNLTIARK